MFLRLVILCMVGQFLSPFGHAGSPVRDGERLTYRVSWAIVPGAGEIKISAAQAAGPDGPRLAVTTTTATRRLARMLLPFDAEAKSLFDLKTGRLMSLHETSTQRDKRSETHVTFDYATRQATYVGTKSESQPILLPIPDGDPTDLIMGLLQTRSWNLKLGDNRDALVLFGNDFYELTITHTRDEEVRTPLGKFSAMVLEPRMEKTAPKGMFKKGSTVRVWIAQDELHLPVKFEVEFKIGTGTATLVAYNAPGVNPPAPSNEKDPRP